MKRILIFLAIFILPAHAFLIEAQAQDVKKQEIRKQMDSLSVHLQPSVRQRVIQSAQALEDKIFSPGSRVDVYAASVSSIKRQFRGLSSQDIDALAAMVMFELWQSDEEALKEITDEMHKMNQEKEKQRDYINSLKKQKAAMKENLKEKSIALHSAQTRAVVPKVSQVTARTRRLNIKYAKTPIMPAFKDPRRMTVSELENEIRAAEDNQKAIEDMSQLDQLALQDTLQKEEAIIQTISDIARQQEDTLKGIIENIR